MKTQEKKKNSPKMKNFSISRREPLLFHFFLFLFSSFEILEESVMLARYTLSLFKYSAIRTTQFSGIMNSKRLFSVDSTVTDDDFVSTDIGKKKAAAQRRLKEIAEESERLGREKAKKDFLEHKDPNYPFELEDDEWVEMIDPKTGEWNPPRGCFEGAEPTRYGDWERKGRCTDF